MKPSLETADCSQFQGHEIKEQRAVGFSRQADQFPFRLRGRRIVDVLQVRGLSTQSGAVVNDLAINLSGCVVDKSHRTEKLGAGYASEKRLSISSSVIPEKCGEILAPAAESLSISAKVLASSCEICFEHSLTRPKLDRSSNATTNSTRPITQIWMLSFSPS